MRIRVKGVFNSLVGLLKQIKTLISINSKHHKSKPIIYHGRYIEDGEIKTYEYECEPPKLSNNNLFYIKIDNYELEKKSLEGPI